MWRILYDDGTEVVDNLDEVKPFGVICIVQEKADGRNHILSQKDYYAFNGQQWVVLDMMGVVDHLVHKPENIKKFVVGRTIDNISFWKIMDKAQSYV